MIKNMIAFLAAAVTPISSDPSAWIPLVTVIGGIVVTLTTAIIGLFVALSTKKNTDTIIHSVNGAATAAQNRELASQAEIKRLSKIVEKSAGSGQQLTEREVELILSKPAAPLIDPAPKPASVTPVKPT